MTRRRGQTPARGQRNPKAQKAAKERARRRDRDADLVDTALGLDADSAIHTAPPSQSAGPSTPPATGQTRTAKNTRQIIPTPGLEGIRGQVVHHKPLTRPLGSTRLTAEVVHVFRDEIVEESIDFIRTTGVHAFTDDRRNALKLKPGRPHEISSFAVLVALHLLAREDSPMLITEMRDLLYRRLSPTMQRMLDIRPDKRPENGPALRRWKDRTHVRVRRAFHRFLSTIDYSVLPKNRRRTWEEIDRLKKPLTTEEQQERRAAMMYVANRLLDAAVMQLPPETLERARHNNPDGKPAYALDGTPLAAFARGRGLNDEQASTDPDAAWYVRQGDHRDPADIRPGDPFKKSSQDTMIFGYEMHLLITAQFVTDGKQYVPSLPVAFYIDKPGLYPAGAARQLMVNLEQRGYPPGWLGGDNLYTNQHGAEFQIPARQAGFNVVLGYNTTQTGIQETHAHGMPLIDGNYFAPCIPDDLVDIVRDRREGRLGKRDFHKMLLRRAEYRMRNKTQGKNGNGERLMCPAAGASPTAICALKKSSLKDRPRKQATGAVADTRRTIDPSPVLTNGEPPTVCKQQTVSISIEDGAKYRQDLLYGSAKHAHYYTSLRNSQEGVHGTAKDEAAVALANPGRRRTRGIAALYIFSAFALVAVTWKRIKRFMEESEVDEHGHRFVRVKAKPEGDDTAKGLPGDATPADPPDPSPGDPPSWQII